MAILRAEFPTVILQDEDCFASGEQTEVLLHLLSDKEVVTRLRKKWDLDPERSSQDKWDDIKKEANSRPSNNKVVSPSVFFNTLNLILP